MPPMPPPVVAAQSGSATGSAGPGTGASPSPEQIRREDPPRPGAEPGDPAQAAQRSPALYAEDIIRSTEQFLAMFNRLGRQGGILQIAAGAEIELPTILIEGTGRYRILAEPGTRRPRLRFRPSPSAQRSPVDWTVMLNLRSGSLHLEGIDLVVPDAEALRRPRGGDRRPARNRARAGRLHAHPRRQPPRRSPFCGSTRGCRGQSARRGQRGRARRGDPRRDGFLRSGGEGFAVAAGRRLELELANVLVSTEASLLHAFGGIRPGSAETPAVKVRMEQVTARVKGGLIHLDSTPDEPELPFATIAAENSIVSTANRDDPLFRLDGRDQLDDLGEKIHWEGRKVAYDRIKTYRRDEIVRIGGPADLRSGQLDQRVLAAGRVAHPGRREVPPRGRPHPGCLESRARRSALAQDSPIADVGSDLARIPQAPSSNEL